MHVVENESRKNLAYARFFCYSNQSMDWSTRKKMGCFSLIGIVVFLILGYFIYNNFIKTEPTCFDGKQNQNERGIDCGGVCERVCPMDARTIVPLWSRAFEITPGVYSAVAYLENQNTTAGIPTMNWELRTYDEKNILTSEPIQGTTFIGPNERTALFVSPIITGNRIPHEAFFSFSQQFDWQRTDPRFQVPQLISRSIVLTDESSAPKISAEIVNNTSFNYRNVAVIVIIYNQAGNAIHASQTILDIIEQQSAVPVFFSWPRPFSDEVSRIEIISRINPFTP